MQICSRSWGQNLILEKYTVVSKKSDAKSGKSKEKDQLLSEHDGDQAISFADGGYVEREIKHGGWNAIPAWEADVWKKLTVRW
jgi:hypothetical protein